MHFTFLEVPSKPEKYLSILMCTSTSTQHVCFLRVCEEPGDAGGAAHVLSVGANYVECAAAKDKEDPEATGGVLASTIRDNINCQWGPFVGNFIVNDFASDAAEPMWYLSRQDPTTVLSPTTPPRQRSCVCWRQTN